MRILVIEDDQQTLDMLLSVLERDGHSAVGERTGKGGRQQATNGAWDAILCDIGLPDVTGFVLVRQLRESGLQVPILALSGHDSDADRKLGLASGFDAYLTKPIKASALTDALRLHAGRVRSPSAVGSYSSPIVAVPSRRRGVLGGLVVIALGVPFVLQPLGLPNAASYLFITMGVAFLVSYVRGRQYVYLIPMVTLVSFGVALLLPTWIPMRPEAVGPAFVGVMAVGFVVAFALAPQHRWPLVPAVLLGIVAAGRLVTGSSLFPTSFEPFLVPLALIAVGAYLLAERQT
jgi:CheY-like chemotaxis protein